MGLAELLDLLAALRPRATRLRLVDCEALADVVWARGQLSPRPTEIERDGEAIVELLARLVAVVLLTADSEGQTVPFIGLTTSPARPGISMRGESLEFFHEGGQWLAQVGGHRDRVIRLPPMPAKAKPAESELLGWARDITREFIARRIGEQS